MLRIDRGEPDSWELSLGGRWGRGPADTLVAEVSGTLRSSELTEPATGVVTLRPLRLPGGLVIGARQITLEVTAARDRLLLTGEPGSLPYLLGITLSGRLDGPSGDAEIKTWIAPAQLLELWLRLNL